MEEEMIPEAPVSLHAEESILSEELGSGGGDVPAHQDAGEEAEAAAAAMDSSSSPLEPVIPGADEAEEAPAGPEASSKPAIVGGSSPSEASSEWPSSDAPPATRLVTYYLVKVPRRPQNEELNFKVQDKIVKRDSISQELQTKRDEKSKLMQQLAVPRATIKRLKDDLTLVKKEIEEKYAELNKFPKVTGLCESEDQIEVQVAELEYEIQHGSLTLSEEKKALRDIQRLKTSRGQVIQNVANDAKRKEVYDQIKPLVEEREKLRKEKDKLAKESVEAEVKLDQVLGEIKELERKRTIAVGAFSDLAAEQKIVNENIHFFNARDDIQSARKLALEHNKQAVEELCQSQMEKYLEMYFNDPVFRSEYVANNYRSTVKRLGTPDGRSLGVDEAPIRLDEPSSSSAINSKQSDNNKEELATKEAPKQVGSNREQAKPGSKEVAKPGIKEQAKPGSKDPAKPGNKEQQAKLGNSKPPMKEAPAAKPGKSKPDSGKKEEARHKQILEPEPELEPEPVVEEEEEDEVDEEAERKKRRQESIEKARLAELRKKKKAEKKEKKNTARLERKEMEKEKQRKTNEEATSTLTEDAAEEEASGGVVENGSVENGVHELINNNKKVEPASRQRGGKRGGKPAKSPVARPPPYKKKRSLQRQLLDNWQLIVAALLVILVVAGSSMAFIHA